jgi:poly(3-hydroxyalkanoate) depolymerase
VSIQMDTKTITLSGNQTIRVSIKPGAPNSIPLLCFNGIGANLSLFTPFVEAMHESNPDIEIITFDVPGVGGSSTPSLPYRFSGLAKTVSQVLDYLNYAQVDVLGLSWGGFLATQFAYDHPQRCKKLILCATATGVTSIPPSMKVLSLMASPRRYSDSAYMIEIAPLIYGGKFRSDPELAIKYAQKMEANRSENKANTTGYKFQQLAICWWSSLWMLPYIKQPALLIGGSDDPIIPLVNMKIMKGLITNSKLHVVDDGHLFLLCSTDVVTPIITEFLEN